MRVISGIGGENCLTGPLLSRVLHPQAKPFDFLTDPVEFGKPNKMENILEIITQPDNIAILVMLVAVISCTVVAFREAILNDRFIKNGEKEKIYERMTR